MNPLSTVLASFRKEFYTVGLFSGVANLLMLAPTIYMLQVFDRVMLSGSELTLLVVSLVTLFFFVMMAFSEWSRSRVLVRAGVRLDDQLSTLVFNAVFQSHLAQTKQNVSRAFSDLTELRQFLTGNGTIAFFDAPWTPIYIAVLFLLHPFLGWMAIGFVLVQLALAVLGHAKSLKPTHRAAEAQAEETRFVQTKLRGAELAEALGMTSALRAKWQAKRLEARTAQAHSQGATHRMASISKFVRYTQQSLSLAAGAYLVIQGEISPGAMIAANVLATRALAPIDLLVSSWKGFLSAKDAYERLATLLKAYPLRDQALSKMPPQGHLTLRGVSLVLPGRERPVLADITTAFAPGTVTVVLGPSGSGKSSLARLLVGIWPHTGGELLLDARPLSTWNREELGPHIGYLPQEVELFEGSIAENIARMAEVDSNQVVVAARMAGLHELILRMPKGYDTPIGEAGRLLSGGQRQRIALARALYGDPQILVLDEPNANLDDQGERALMQALVQAKAQGKTIVLISHRTAAVQLADNLLVLKDGRVQAQGPRNTLIPAASEPRTA